MLAAKGVLEAVKFTANGPGGIFALYEAPGTPLGRVFLNEFVCVCRPALPYPSDNSNFSPVVFRDRPGHLGLP